MDVQSDLFRASQKNAKEKSLDHSGHIALEKAIKRLKNQQSRKYTSCRSTKTFEISCKLKIQLTEDKNRYYNDSIARFIAQDL